MPTLEKLRANQHDANQQVNNLHEISMAHAKRIADLEDPGRINGGSTKLITREDFDKLRLLHSKLDQQSSGRYTMPPVDADSFSKFLADLVERLAAEMRK